MIVHFTFNIYKSSYLHLEMSRWLMDRVYEPPLAKSWAFLYGVGSYSDPGYDRIIFLNEEDALAFKLVFQEWVYKVEG